MQHASLKYTPFVLAAAMIFSITACQPKAADSGIEATADTAGAEAAVDTTAAATTAAPEAAPEDAANATPDPATAAPAEDGQPAAEPTPEELARAKQQAKLDYATMEDEYINDPKGQWASSAKASSTYGLDPGTEPAATGSYVPMRATGTVDNKYWSNRSRDIGFDSITLDYEHPASASEIRIVLNDGKGAKGLTKVELFDGNDQAHTIWSGLSENKPDDRGERTWIVHKLEPTAYQAKRVKLTFANNVENGYSYVDAVQLISP